MKPLLTRRTFLRIAPGGALACAAGCGTIFHPERRGQPAGKLDWKIVALDAVGLLFFFVPGVIAFAVDFATGTIYLPAEECVASPPGLGNRRLAAVPLPADECTPATIELALARVTGREVHLKEGGYRTRPLDRLDQFWTAHSEQAAG